MVKAHLFRFYTIRTWTEYPSTLKNWESLKMVGLHKVLKGLFSKSAEFHKYLQDNEQALLEFGEDDEYEYAKGGDDEDQEDGQHSRNGNPFISKKSRFFKVEAARRAT